MRYFGILANRLHITLSKSGVKKEEITKAKSVSFWNNGKKHVQIAEVIYVSRK